MTYGKTDIDEKLMARADMSTITDRLYLSGSILDYNLLNEIHIGAVINLRAEQHDDVWELTKRGIAYYWIPIADWGAPRSDQINACMRAIKENHRVLVHCAVGKGRAAFMVITWLLLADATLSVVDAIKKVTDIRSVVDLTDNQKRKLAIQFPGR